MYVIIYLLSLEFRNNNFKRCVVVNLLLFSGTVASALEKKLLILKIFCENVLESDTIWFPLIATLRLLNSSQAKSER